MNASTFETSLERTGIIAILRNVPDEHAESLANALIDGGIEFIEVSLIGRASIRQLGVLAEAFGDQVWIGAGTVTSSELANEAQVAGASYLITPHVQEAVAAFATEHKLGLILGALTPTEIVRAQALGSPVVKVFPAATMGPAYFAALRGPYPGAKLLAVGGVNQGNLETYLSAGAIGAALGSSLTALDWEHPDFSRARDVARSLVTLATRHKNGRM